ncbi:hypothetical protein WG906_09765 [Pedobacter sp. P351]|uniref:hypothetical protein n=1 Tax=Pedobacter superstes TaxID=3133441 RepID=UPI0030A056A8
MLITMEFNQLKQLMTDCVELGTKSTLIELNILKPFLSKNEAYKKYGRGTVDRWIKEGNLKAIKDGTTSSSIRLDRITLEILSKASTRHTYLTSIERKEVK